jgi:hypothetical protein
MRTITARMHDPFGNPLMVEMKHLLTEVKVVDDEWSQGPDAKRVLVVRNWSALGGRQYGCVAFGYLV